MHGRKNIKRLNMSLYLVKSLEPRGYFVFHQVEHYKILRSAHTLYLCVL